MEIKTDIRVHLDLHFTNDDMANDTELARLASVVKGLHMLLAAQSPGQSVSRETPLPPFIAQAGQIEAGAAVRSESVSRETPAAEAKPSPIPPPAPYRERNQQREFVEFDRQIRAEMQRLAVDGRIPSGPRWNAERDRQLPSITTVLNRYKRQCGVAGMSDLAKHFGLKPALIGKAVDKPPGANGHHEPRRRL